MEKINSFPHGQGLVEYALILVLVVIIVILALTVFGGRVSDIFSTLIAGLEGKNADDTVSIPFLLNDFSDRIMSYYNEKGSWPRSWGDYAYTDIGLDPDDWDEPVEGIYWKPHGSNFGLANIGGDGIELYVTDLSCNEKHVYKGWSVWCVRSSDRCYIHSMQPDNEVEFSTLRVVQTE